MVRFITSLTTAKVYATPPSIDRLSEIFQDFYVQAEAHISTHIQALSSKQSREASPAPSISSKVSASGRVNSKLSSKASRDSLNQLDKVTPQQQMLTPNEISERRKARKLLEYKKVALDEAVERRVCEGIYSQIWRHRSTLDEVKDEKLRSRTAALALVGIGLKDLGIDFEASHKLDESSEILAFQVEEEIAKARECLFQMNASRSPLAKLQNLASAHQSIVGLLTKLHQSSSSADEILPTLIYTLITSPAEQVNAISNLNFIQRFRAANKINGEAAYCLTNLEAAITFLENVDLASLRADEHLEGPSKSSSRPSTPRFEVPAPWNPALPSHPGISPAATDPETANSTPLNHLALNRPLPSPTIARPSPPVSPSHQRRLSTLFQPPTNPFTTASDAVRSTADQSFKNISNTLDSSLKLLFGRLKEQHIQGEGTTPDGTIIVPKTLDEARQLVSPKPALPDDDGTLSEASSFTEHPDFHADEPQARTTNPKHDDRLLDLITGGRGSRDRSVDSGLSTSSSGKRVAFASETKATRENSASPAPPATATSSPPSLPAFVSAPNAAVESMRSLGNTLNPLNRFAGMNVMRGFGRANSTPPPVVAPVTVEAGKENEMFGKRVVKVEPPVQRFLDVAGSEELRVGEVGALLGEYRRLVGALREMGAF